MWTIALAAAFVAPPVQDLLTLQHAPLAEMLRHPKDAGLLRLMAHAPAALERFFEEQGDPAPPGAIELLTGLLTAGKTVVLSPSEDPNMPFAAAMTFDAADEASAARRQGLLVELLAQTGAALGVPGANGLALLDAPTPVPIAMGTVGRRLAVNIGTERTAAAPAVAAGLPTGVTPWFEWYQSPELMRLLMTLDGGGGPEMDAFLEAFGTTTIRLAMGSDGRRSWSATHAAGAAQMLRAAAAYPEGGLQRAAFGRIPEDAVFAAVTRMEWPGIWRLIEQQVASVGSVMGEDQQVDIQAELAQALGFDPVTEVLPHFGPTTGMYISDTTGGGSILSAVVFTEVRDARAVADLAARLVAFVQQEAGEQVELRTLRAGELELTSLVFPGLPIPIAPTWVVDGGYLYLGLSPQAAAAAAEVARSGRGLLQNPRFATGLEAVGFDPSVVSATFFDTPALLRDGYPYMTLAMDAVGNLARRAGVADDLGLLMPSLGALSRGAEASISVSRVVGDDTTSLACGDLSWTVNLTALAGLFDRSGLMMVLPMAVMGASQSAGFGANDWEESGEMEYHWHEPLIEGGALVALSDWMVADAEGGDGTVLAQLELHLQSDSGELSIFVTDAEVTQFVRTAQPKLVVTIYPDEGEPFDLTLEHVANEETGEVAGDSAHYRVIDSRIQGWMYLGGSLQSLTVGDATFEGVSVWCSAN